MINLMTHSTKPNEIQMHSADKAILKIIQKDSQMSHSAIGERIGLSTSAVRRRIVALRENGLILREVALLDPNAYGISLIVHIAFSEDSSDSYAAFDRKMLELPNVKQSYHVSGATDYILIVQGPSLQWYEDWAKKHIMTQDAVKRHDTTVVWSCKKFDTEILL